MNIRAVVLIGFEVLLFFAPFSSAFTRNRRRSGGGTTGSTTTAAAATTTTKTTINVSAGLAGSSGGADSATSGGKQQQQQLFEDDESFWMKFTETGPVNSFLSLPPPTSPPTKKPRTPKPTETPTVAKNPSIEIIKSAVGGADIQQVRIGDPATFEITVTNTGDVDLADIKVSDALARRCNNNVGDLAVGESTTYQCTVKVTKDFTNVADVTGKDPNGKLVKDKDPSEVDAIEPSIKIIKSAAGGGDAQQVRVGDSATFKITVTNDGDVDLTNVKVRDKLAPGCDSSIGNLAVGESTTHQCFSAKVTEDFTNVADVTGKDPNGKPVKDEDPSEVDAIEPSIKIIKSAGGGGDTQQVRVGDMATFEITVTNDGDVDLTDVKVSDKLAPNCDSSIGNLDVGESTTYTCRSENVNGSFTNVADVSGKDPNGDTVKDEDPSEVDAIEPSIKIIKSAEAGGDSHQVRKGDTASFEITVTNNGNVDLTDVTVRDPRAPKCDKNIGRLDVGESTTYTCRSENVNGSFTNVADVTGKDPNGDTVKDEDPSEVVEIDPNIRIVKSAEAGGDSQQVRKGDKASFEITVTNNGNVDLTDVTVRDPRAPKCDKNIGRLDVGESTTYTCRSEDVNGSFTNVADVTGKDPNGDTVKDEDPSEVVEIGPNIKIVKSAEAGGDSQQVRKGDTASFEITVTNNGNVDLTDVTVRDPKAPKCNRNIGDLAVGESITYECTMTVTEGFTNLADVTGNDPNGDPVSDEDPTDVDAIEPSIKIVKSSAGGDDTQKVMAGKLATFDITVTNDGDVDLTDVKVSDALAPKCNRDIGDLAIGKSTTYECSVEVTEGFTNIAEVTGNDPNGDSVKDTDPSKVEQVQTPKPTPAPTEPPTQTPTKSPTKIPTPKPTIPPSMPPTNVQCNVTTTIDCKTTSGMDCDKLTYPEGSCEAGEGLEVLSFRYVPCTCPDSRNSQEGVAVCTDIAPINPDNDVRVSCVSGEGIPLDVSPAIVGPEDSFSVRNSNGGRFPAFLICFMSSNDDLGLDIQENVIATSGTTTLDVNDKFGSLTLESCDELSCVEELCYLYSMSNVGSSDMEVTKVDRYYNGELVNLLPFVPTNPLAPGQTSIIEEKVFISVCQELVSRVNVEVEAEPENGFDCQADGTYEFEISTPPPKPDPLPKPKPTPRPTTRPVPRTPRPTEPATTLPTTAPTPLPPKPDPLPKPKPTPRPTERPTAAPTSERFCNVTALIDCKTTTGINCNELSFPEERCSVGTELDVITFQYTPCTCDESKNSQEGPIPICSDWDTIDFTADVKISCRGEDGASVNVQPGTIAPEGTVTATNPNGGSLPVIINCTITDSNGVLIQENLIDTSGTVTLNLNDKFGGLTVKACDTLNCLEELCYLYSFANIGSSDMEVSKVERYYNGEVTNLLPFAPVNPLQPGQSSVIEEKITLDVCQQQSSCVDIDVEASPENGVDCQANDTYKIFIETPPPTPKPTLPPFDPVKTPEPTVTPTEPCVIEFTSTCIPPPPATDCAAIPPAVQQCEGRPLMMGMLYNGGDCSQSFNVQEDKFSCVDLNGGPPTIDGEESYIVVTDAKGDGIVYHSDYVPVGTIFYLTDNNERFVADQYIDIYSSDQISDATHLQDVEYHSSCSSNLFLKDRFGASQLVEWYNEEQGLITCFANATFDLSVTIPIDIQGDTLTLTSLVSITSWGVFNLTDDVYGTVVEPGDTIQASFIVTLDLTQVRTYELLTEIIGITNERVECRGVDFYTFTAGTDLETLPIRDPNAGSNKGGGGKSKSKQNSKGANPSEEAVEQSADSSVTRDSTMAACSLEAGISCAVVHDNDASCSQLSSPTSSVCIGDRPNRMNFIYDPRPCSGSNTSSTDFVCQDQNGGPELTSSVNIKIKSKDETFIDTPVGPGEVITIYSADDVLPEILLAQISSTTGSRLQTMEFSTGCDEGNDISLLTYLGSLQLTAFDNQQLGYQSAIDNILYSYTVRNNGEFAAVVEWANLTSTLFGEMPLIAPPGNQLESSAEFAFPFGPIPFNHYSSNGQPVTSTFSVSGYGSESDAPCSDQAIFDFAPL